MPRKNNKPAVFIPSPRKARQLAEETTGGFVKTILDRCNAVEAGLKDQQHQIGMLLQTISDQKATIADLRANQRASNVTLAAVHELIEANNTGLRIEFVGVRNAIEAKLASEVNSVKGHVAMHGTAMASGAIEAVRIAERVAGAMIRRARIGFVIDDDPVKQPTATTDDSDPDDAEMEF